MGNVGNTVLMEEHFFKVPKYIFLIKTPSCFFTTAFGVLICIGDSCLAGLSKVLVNSILSVIFCQCCFTCWPSPWITDFLSQQNATRNLGKKPDTVPLASGSPHISQSNTTTMHSLNAQTPADMYIIFNALLFSTWVGYSLIKCKSSRGPISDPFCPYGLNLSSLKTWSQKPS